MKKITVCGLLVMGSLQGIHNTPTPAATTSTPAPLEVITEQPVSPAPSQSTPLLGTVQPRNYSSLGLAQRLRGGRDHCGELMPTIGCLTIAFVFSWILASSAHHQHA